MSDWPNNILKDENGNELSDEEKIKRLQENIKAVTSLKNVLYGFMTAKNKINYFEPMINIINQQKK